jgi:hypothetical protein
MNGSTAHQLAPLFSGFQALLVLGTWCAVVLLFGLYRSWLRPEPDPIRPSGPTER